MLCISYNSIVNRLRQDAEILRKKGYSYNMITDELGISSGTLSYWFKDKPFTPNKQVLERIKYGPIKNGAKSHNRRVREISRLKKQGREELGELSKRDIWLLGIGLYIGEGSKTTEMIKISNSDPAVICVAINWLETMCGLTSDNLAIRLHIYPDTDVRQAISYWMRVTELPKTSFRNVTIDSRDNKKRYKKGKLPYGTAHLYVVANGDASKGVKLYRRINGWVAGALNQI